MQVLPPVCIFDADRMTEQRYQDAAATVRQALADLPAMTPMPYRYQNFGDYDHGTLQSHILPGETGLSIHTQVG